MPKKATPGPTEAASQSARPKKVTALLCQGETYPGWYTANKQTNKFYVVNLGIVIDELRIDYTKHADDFAEATRIINEETEWSEEYTSNYKCSHTQLRTPYEAKHFGIAAAIIVAMEVIARAKKPGCDIYGRLRILPAQYFVDLLDVSRLAQLKKYYTGLSDEARIESFGPDAVSASFETVCLRGIEQDNSEGLLDEIVKGYCITKYAAMHLEQFINGHFPKELHVGPVRGAGDFETIRESLGQERAAATLRVPKTLPEDRLGPSVVLD